MVVERGRSFGHYQKRSDDPVEYWYFRVAGGKAEVVERIRGSDMGRPRVYRWGVPYRLAVSVYPTLEKLVETAQTHPEWWHRTHAMQAAVRLLTSPGPGVGEDDARQYAVLREAALKRKEALLDLLIASLSDGNAAIREGAQSGLEQIFGEELGEDPKAWTKRRRGS